MKTAYAKYNLSIGVGLSKVAGKVFRIGHLGNCDEIMSASALAGEAHTCSGQEHVPEAGVARTSCKVHA